MDDIVSYEFLQNKRVIGIRDKDYESAPSCDRVFFCDYCCAEMMIVSIDSCFRRLYLNFYEHGQYNYEQLRLLCLQCLEKLSKYRMLNEQKRWAIRFDGIKPGNHYNINQVAMDKAILAEINRQNQYNTIDSKRENDCNSLSKCNALCDLLNITNGHDFIQLFCSLCKLNNRKNISISEIEISMRSVFGEESFRKTKLYRQLKQYQEQNNLTIVA